MDENEKMEQKPVVLSNVFSNVAGYVDEPETKTKPTKKKGVFGKGFTPLRTSVFNALKDAAENNECSTSVRKLAKGASVSMMGCQKGIEWLMANGYIERTRKGGGGCSSCFRILKDNPTEDTPAPKTIPPVTQIEPDDEKQIDETIIDSNNEESTETEKEIKEEDEVKNCEPDEDSISLDEYKQNF